MNDNKINHTGSFNKKNTYNYSNSKKNYSIDDDSYSIKTEKCFNNKLIDNSIKQNNIEFLLKDYLSTNEEIKFNDRPLTNQKKSPCLIETLYNKPPLVNKLKDKNISNRSLRISFKDRKFDREENIKENIKIESDEKINKDNFLPQKINAEDNEITLKDLDNIIEIEENKANNNFDIGGDLNLKVKEIKKTVSDLKLSNYDSNSTNDICNSLKSPVFSEEELMREVDKVNQNVINCLNKI